MKFKIFTNDVGPHAYSCFTEVVAGSQAEANREAIRLTRDLPSDPDRADQTLRVFAAPAKAEWIDAHGRLYASAPVTVLNIF